MQKMNKADALQLFETVNSFMVTANAHIDILYAKIAELEKKLNERDDSNARAAD